MSYMYLETRTAYHNGTPSQYTPTSDATGPDGANALPGVLGTAAFWQSTMGFGTVWSMTSVARGYPKLANVGGQ